MPVRVDAVIYTQLIVTESKTPQSSTSSARLLGLARMRPVLRARDVSAQGPPHWHADPHGQGRHAGEGRPRTIPPGYVGPNRKSFPRPCLQHRPVERHLPLDGASLSQPRDAAASRSVARRSARDTRPIVCPPPYPHHTDCPSTLRFLGIEEHRIEGGVVRVYNVVRTVVGGCPASC